MNLSLQLVGSHTTLRTSVSSYFLLSFSSSFLSSPPSTPLGRHIRCGPSGVCFLPIPYLSSLCGCLIYFSPKFAATFTTLSLTPHTQGTLADAFVGASLRAAPPGRVLRGDVPHEKSTHRSAGSHVYRRAHQRSASEIVTHMLNCKKRSRHPGVTAGRSTRAVARGSASDGAPGLCSEAAHLLRTRDVCFGF